MSQAETLVEQLQRSATSYTKDIEPSTLDQLKQLNQSLELAKVFKQITDQIRSTLDLQAILQTITQEVQKLLLVDRVLIYKFSPDLRGQVVVESVVTGWIPVIGQVYADECFPREYAMRYREGRIRSIDNVLASDLHPCHKAFLQEIQVQANLVVPIGYGEELWGLLIAHQCNAPRSWESFEVDLLQQLADQSAIAIHQAELYEQSQASAAQAKSQAEELQRTLEQLQQTQAQLVQTEKMSSLGQLVAGIAHEINNPVNFIYGNLNYVTEYTQDLFNLVQLYQKNYAPPAPEIQSQLESIDLDFIATDLPRILTSMRVGTDRIRQIVLALRHFSRFDQADLKQVNIHEGLESALMLLQHRLMHYSRGRTIQVDKQYSQLPNVECYAGQLNQVFINILNNAISALEESFRYPLLVQEKPVTTPTITIKTEVRDNCAVIRIADNGPGIPDDIQYQIFDPFFTTKPIGKGTGLGLTISYQVVVEKHGGTLKCHSHPGQGSEFYITIPLTQS